MRASRSDKCWTILSSLLGQPLANIKREAGCSLDPCLFRYCLISVHLTRCNISQLCIDLRDLSSEGFHVILNGFHGRAFLKETANSFPLALNIGLPLLDSLV